MNILFNIAAAVLLCGGCFLVLWATIALARRRFFEPWLDKKQIIIALCCFLAAGLLFVPSKSSDRGVKRALADITLAINHTQLTPATKLIATIKTTAGNVIKSEEYEASVYDEGALFTIKSSESTDFPKVIRLFADNIQDTVYAKAVESRHTDKCTSYTLEKGLKSIFAQKSNILKNFKAEAKGTAFESLLQGFQQKGTVYQWIETYNIDKAGLNSFEVFFNGKNHEGKNVELIYSFVIVQ